MKIKDGVRRAGLKVGIYTVILTEDLLAGYGIGALLRDKGYVSDKAVLAEGTVNVCINIPVLIAALHYANMKIDSYCDRKEYEEKYENNNFMEAWD